MAQDLVLTPESVHTFAMDVLLAFDMPEKDATTVADSMLWAALHGRITHSLVRLGLFAERARAGGLSVTTDWTPVREHGVVTLLDGGHTWGPLAGARGMRHAMDKARRLGVGVTSIRNCDYTGALSWYTSLALDEKMIGYAIGNTLPLMTIWGGAGKRVGNQPLSFAAPAGKHAPFVLDQMFGAIRLNVPRIAAAEGTQLPPGAASDADGAPTTDPKKYFDGGALLPTGGHRGSGVALMSEVLTGVLSGGPIMNEVGGQAPGETEGNALYLMAMDPGAFLPDDAFLDRMDQFIEQIQETKPAPGVDRVRVPGADREVLAAERHRTGIPFPAEQVTRLRNLAADLGVRWPG